MKIIRNGLDAAVQENILSPDQADRLYAFFKAQPATGPSFDFTHVLYYLGGLVAIGAMTLFMTLGWEQFGGWGIFWISLAYAALGLVLATTFRTRGLAVPAGICAAFVVAMAPLAIYGLQVAVGWWPDDTPYRDYHRYIRWHWIYLELGTLAVGAIVAYVYRYPFLQLPIAITLWYLSMDLAAFIAGGRPSFELRALVSTHFGLAMTLLAFWVDLRSAKSGDHAFWLYLFGVLTFWGGLTAQNPDGELAKSLYLLVNLGLIGVGVVLVRRVFVVFGALGCANYLGHLAYDVFADSWLFPIALTAIGFGIIGVGVVWQRKEETITKRVRSFLPGALRALLEVRAG